MKNHSTKAESYLFGIKERMVNHFHLSVMMLFTVCVVLILTPFAIYCFIHNQPLWAWVNIAIIIAALPITFHAWRTQSTQYSGPAMAMLGCLGSIVVSLLLVSEIGPLWVTPALLASFILAPPFTAIAINMITVALLVMIPGIFQSTQQLLEFTISCCLVSAMAGLFFLYNQTQQKQLEHQAGSDPLTQVLNRRSLMRQLSETTQLARRTKTPHVLIMMDLDHFKSVNDRHGHKAGDALLIQCAHILRQYTRHTDKVFRLGGDEFAILLTDITIHNAAMVLKNIQLQMRAKLGKTSALVGASYGVTQLYATESSEAWIARTDKALYRAKHAGRNRMEIDTTLSCRERQPFSKAS